MWKIFGIFLFTLIVFAANSLNAQNGIIKTYYEDGTIRESLSFSDDVYNGTSYWYYRNGNVKLEKTYSDGVLNGWIKKYYKTGLLKEEFRVEMGVKDGLHKFYYENGGLAEVRTYENGVLKRQKKLDYDSTYQAPVTAYQEGNRQQQKEEEELLCDADICPKPAGGMESIYEKLEYPKHAKIYGLEGTVKLIAAVNEKGKVINTNVIEGLGLGCDEAAETAVKNTLFIPGQRDGKVVTSNLTLNVEFKLEDKSEIAKSSKVPKGLADGAGGISSDSLQSLYREMKDTIQTVNKEKQPKRFFECEIEVCAKPAGGIDAIMKNLNYPRTAVRRSIEGDVIVKAVVDEYGYVRKTKVLKDIGAGCGVAAEVAILDTKFQPGVKNGERVESEVVITIPFEFKK
jgi:TonB family protein